MIGDENMLCAENGIHRMVSFYKFRRL